jgi:hypothetical protein
MRREVYLYTVRIFRRGGNILHDDRARLTALTAVRMLHTVFFLELIHTSAGIKEFLFASVERMAIRANLDTDVRTNRTRFEGVTACAGSRRHLILRMDCFFQGVHLLSALDQQSEPE